jgi:CDP-diglyceride synthetase
VISAGALVTDYAIQLAVMQPRPEKGEIGDLSLFSQYNPHGVFIALEDLGYLLRGVAFFFLAAALGRSEGFQRAVRILYFTASVLAVGSHVLLALLFGADLDYRYEVAAIAIDWIALIVSGVLKVAILYGLDTAFLMPGCMLLNDISAAVVGVAIVKDRLLDITLIVKKTAIYSVLAALVVLVFSVSEHLLATYVGEQLGESSTVIYVISIAAVIAVVMPFRTRVERTVETCVWTAWPTLSRQIPPASVSPPLATGRWCSWSYTTMICPSISTA